MILLDTDHLSIFARSEGNAAPTLRRKILDHHRATGEIFAITAISLEEQMRGWLGRISRERDVEKQVESYKRLIELVGLYARWQIAPFDVPAANRLRDLRQARVRIGTMDLKIASIALTCDALLLTANVSDFGQVPGLRTENWLV